MQPPLLLRPPLLWLVIAETLVVTALGVATWHVWLAHQASSPAVAAAPAHQAPAHRGSVPPRTPTSSPPPAAVRSPRPGATPGLRTDPEFLSRQMNELNQVESTFENLEWRLTKAVVDAIQYYVDRVVLPSIDRTEKAAR